MIVRIGIGAAALLTAGGAAAQDKAETPLHKAVGAPDELKLSGTFRVQIEGIDGQFRPTAARADRLLTFRTTLAAEYDAGPVRVGAEMWDARAYLEEPRTRRLAPGRSMRWSWSKPISGSTLATIRRSMRGG